MDYLARLIQRSARTAPAVQPLLRPRYAPDEADTLPPDEAADHAVEEDARAAPAPPVGFADVPLTASEPEEQRSSRTPHPPESEATDAPDSAASVALAVPHVSAPQEGGVPAVAAPPVEGTPVSSTAQPPPVTRRHAEPHPADPDTALFASSVRGTGDDRALSPSGGSGEPAGRDGDGLLIPRGTVEAGSPEPDVPPAGGPFVRNGSSQPEPPVVRITIGRLDVRVPPSAPKPASKPEADHAPAAPRLGLDEYLRQGGRG